MTVRMKRYRFAGNITVFAADENAAALAYAAVSGRVASRRVIHDNNRHEITELQFHPGGAKYILKHHRYGSQYPVFRKISFALRTLRTDYSRRAALGARLLEQAGVTTPKPTAYWHRWSPFGCRQSFLLYEKHPAATTLAGFRARFPADVSPLAKETNELLLEKMVAIARRVHDAGLIHNDIATHNILVDTRGGRSGATPWPLPNGDWFFWTPITCVVAGSPFRLRKQFSISVACDGSISRRKNGFASSRATSVIAIIPSGSRRSGSGNGGASVH